MYITKIINVHRKIDFFLKEKNIELKGLCHRCVLRSHFTSPEVHQIKDNIKLAYYKIVRLTYPRSGS